MSEENPGSEGAHGLTFSPVQLPLPTPGPLGPGEAHLWFLDLERLGSPLGQPVPGTFSPRQQRAARRFYLRLLLGAYLGIPGKDVSVLRAERGKPLLDPALHDSDLEFSTAASPCCCLFGFARGVPVGVDLEPLGRRAGKPLGLARRYFSEAETEALGTLEGEALDTAFLRTWSLKEAVVKAAGHGIANQLCRFEVETDPARPPGMRAIDQDDPAAWSLALGEAGGSHLAGLAMRHPEARLKAFSLVPAPGPS